MFVSRRIRFVLIMSVFNLFALAGCSRTNDNGQPEVAVDGSVPVQLKESGAMPAANPLRNAYFGETHMHTTFSLDAYLGGTRLGPDDAYRYAKGESVSLLGQSLTRKRPLDFAAVTDHAEYLGEMYSNLYEGAPGHDHDLLKQLRSMTDLDERRALVHEIRDLQQPRRHAKAPAFFRQVRIRSGVPGKSRSMRQSDTMSPASSQHSLRSNGVRRRREAICIAT